MKTLSRLERIAVVIEDTIEKLIDNADKGEHNIYIYRYHFWMGLMEDEIIKDFNVDTSKLTLTKFMEHTITQIIVRKQTIKDIMNRYQGWGKDDRFHYKYRDEKIKDLYKIRG